MSIKNQYEKYELPLTIGLIIIYVISNSYCLNNFGSTSYKTFLLNLLLSTIITVFIIKNKLTKYYGLTKITKTKEFLYFIPLFLIIIVNFLNGIKIENPIFEITFYILNMLCIGFLEEIIFRGFLFKLLAKDNIQRAIAISTLTFGIGHIVNLLNGADLIPTIIQIGYSLSIGYLFAIILTKGKSLVPCIITHSLLNALSIFCVSGTITTYISPIILLGISIIYTYYLKTKIK